MDTESDQKRTRKNTNTKINRRQRLERDQSLRSLKCMKWCVCCHQKIANQPAQFQPSAPAATYSTRSNIRTICSNSKKPGGETPRCIKNTVSNRSDSSTYAPQNLHSGRIQKRKAARQLPTRRDGNAKMQGQLSNTRGTEVKLLNRRRSRVKRSGYARKRTHAGETPEQSKPTKTKCCSKDVSGSKPTISNCRPEHVSVL